MSEISARACILVLDGAARCGFDRDEVLARAGVPRSVVEDRSRRTQWRYLARIFEALGEMGAQGRDFEAIGEAIMATREAVFMHRVATALVSGRQLYKLVFRLLGPRLFAHLKVRDLGEVDGRLGCEMVVPAPYAAVEGFFPFMSGTLRAVPTVLGLGRAEVAVEQDGRAATFWITPPQEGSLLARAGRLARAMVTPWTMTNLLVEQQRELRERYRAMSRSRSSLQQVMDRTPDAVLVHRDGSIVYANAALGATLGCDELELVGRRVLDLVDHADLTAAEEHLLRPCRSGARREIRLVGADGEWRILDCAGAQELHFDEAPAMLVVARDVSERRRIEEELVRADRLSSLGRMAAGVAHELNNPLAYVNLNLFLLDKALDQIGDLDVRRSAAHALASARHGVDRMRSIVADLTAFARPSTDTSEPIHVGDALEVAVSMVRKQIENRARVVMELEDVPPARGNRARLEQVFVNLVVNAAEAFPDGSPDGHRIVVRAERGESTNGTPRIVVEIADNGPGIARELQQRVFEPFFTTKQPHGTGLGLAICHGIVTGMGGDIELTSTPGEGTSFRISLPADPMARATAPSRDARYRPDRSRPRARVLLIEDEPDLANVLCALLEEENQDVEAVASAREALDLLKSDDAYDFVLCDLMMAEMNGMDLYEELARAGSPVVERLAFMTGGAYTPRARAFVDRVRARCLEKPFTIDRVLALIDDIAHPGGDSPSH